MSERIADLVATPGHGKPRENGITIAEMDRLANEKEVSDLAEYTDIVEFGAEALFLLPRSKLLQLVRQCHDGGIAVQSGGTVAEVANLKGAIPEVLDALESLGIDTITVGETMGRISADRKWNLIDHITSRSMKYVLEVRVDAPGARERRDQLLTRLREAESFKGKKVIVWASELDKATSSSELSPAAWEALNEAAGAIGPPSLVFRAPAAALRTSLVQEFGPDVNLAGVPLGDVLELQLQRSGLTTETFGFKGVTQNIEGSPAAKFVYHLVRTEHPIDQSDLVAKSGLPRRTVQAAIEFLVSGGLVREVHDQLDQRRRRYTLK
jgi:phosphosulfolactate synthase (CoM biosynthesis protein A)